MCHKGQWTAALSTVLLGLRTVLKEDLRCSTAELLYGEQLKLPGEFFVKSENEMPQHELLIKLRAIIEKLRPTPASHHSNHLKTFVHPDMATASHCFVRTDAVRKSLQPPYTGPFPIVERGPKFFKIEIKGQHKNVSVDRLKPAFILATESVSSMKVVKSKVVEEQTDQTETNFRSNKEDLVKSCQTDTVEKTAKSCRKVRFAI